LGDTNLNSMKAGIMRRETLRPQPRAQDRHVTWRRSLGFANGRTKRAVDLVLGVLVTIVSAPVIAVLAIVSSARFRAWPLFVQERLGRDGHPFRFVKIRSLPLNTPSSADKYEIGPATTRWGRFLRGSHLDELPQIWLVVSGRMSLVGPRPEMPELAATFEPTFVEERLLVRPGITGPWQVSTGAERLIGEAPEFDRLYLAHASARFDTWLLLRTLGVLVGMKPIPLDRFPAWVLDERAGADVPTANLGYGAPASHGRPATDL
jgi:lipopolysaccharide/colanic/teichoic acid biosynthesis glycosyltransferase